MTLDELINRPWWLISVKCGGNILKYKVQANSASEAQESLHREQHFSYGQMVETVRSSRF